MTKNSLEAKVTMQLSTGREVSLGELKVST